MPEFGPTVKHIHTPGWWDIKKPAMMYWGSGNGVTDGWIP